MTINTLYEAPLFGQSWWKKFGFSIAGGSHALVDDARRVMSSVAKASLARRHRRADVEISRYIQLNGGFLTDRMEREIERALLNRDVGSKWRS